MEYIRKLMPHGHHTKAGQTLLFISYLPSPIRWGDGHCIGHVDTKDVPSMNLGVPSTEDPDNHIPEPHPNYWGLHCRRTLVNHIRNDDKLGAYAQYPYYDVRGETFKGLSPQGESFKRLPPQRSQPG